MTNRRSAPASRESLSRAEAATAVVVVLVTLAFGVAAYAWDVRALGYYVALLLACLVVPAMYHYTGAIIEKIKTRQDSGAA